MFEFFIATVCLVIGFALGALGSAVEAERQRRHFIRHKNKVLAELDRLSETIEKKIKGGREK